MKENRIIDNKGEEKEYVWVITADLPKCKFQVGDFALVRFTGDGTMFACKVVGVYWHPDCSCPIQGWHYTILGPDPKDFNKKVKNEELHKINAYEGQLNAYNVGDEAIKLEGEEEVHIRTFDEIVGSGGVLQ